jgi:hypothetical protein
MVGVGAWPFVGHTLARQGLEDAASSGATGSDISQLQADQTSHRANWETWGLPVSVVGWAVVGAGALALVAGGGLAASSLVLASDEGGAE